MLEPSPLATGVSVGSSADVVHESLGLPSLPYMVANSSSYLPEASFGSAPYDNSHDLYYDALDFPTTMTTHPAPAPFPRGLHAVLNAGGFSAPDPNALDPTSLEYLGRLVTDASNASVLPDFSNAFGFSTEDEKQFWSGFSKQFAAPHIQPVGPHASSVMEATPVAVAAAPSPGPPPVPPSDQRPASDGSDSAISWPLMDWEIRQEDTAVGINRTESENQFFGQSS